MWCTLLSFLKTAPSEGMHVFVFLIVMPWVVRPPPVPAQCPHYSVPQGAWCKGFVACHMCKHVLSQCEEERDRLVLWCQARMMFGA